MLDNYTSGLFSGVWLYRFSTAIAVADGVKVGCGVVLAVSQCYSCYLSNGA